MKYNSRREVEITTEEIINNGFFKNWSVVDSNGNNYALYDITIVSNAGLIGKWHPKYAGKLVKIDFQLEQQELILKNLVQSICSDIHQNKYTSTIATDFESLTKSIEQSNSVQEIIHLL